jgi:zinc transporter ZupT
MTATVLVPAAVEASVHREGLHPALFLAAAFALAAVHLFAVRLTVPGGVPRSGWLSFGGGISVAYVFLHLLPEVEAGGEAVSDWLALAFLEHHVYLVALAGFVAFYGLERLAKRSGSGRSSDEDGEDGEDDGEGSNGGVFWIHVGSFTAYNFLVGYTLHHRSDLASLVLFTVALALHFVVNDSGLREHYSSRYHDRGRWLVSAAVVAGTAVAFVYPLGEALFATVLAFLAGGIVLNVVKEELPEERESRFSAFAGGAATYTVVLLLV